MMDMDTSIQGYGFAQTSFLQLQFFAVLCAFMMTFDRPAMKSAVFATLFPTKNYTFYQREFKLQRGANSVHNLRQLGPLYSYIRAHYNLNYRNIERIYKSN